MQIWKIQYDNTPNYVHIVFHRPVGQVQSVQPAHEDKYDVKADWKPKAGDPIFVCPDTLGLLPPE
jgi:hypothetical protein